MFVVHKLLVRPAAKGEGEWLLHLDGDRFLLLLLVACLCQLDAARANVPTCGEHHPSLCARYHHRLTKLTQVPEESTIISFNISIDSV